MDPNGNFWGLAVKLAKVALKGGDISLTLAGIVQDAKILMDSSASVSDCAIATASLASEVISPITLRDAKAVKKAVEGKPSVPEGTSSVPAVSRATNRGDNVANGPRLNNQLLAEEVANGLGFQKHVVDGGEFDNLGIKTQSQYQDFVENIVSSPTTEVRYAANGKTFFLDTSTNTVVIKKSYGRSNGISSRLWPGWNRLE
jgi:hypothetical protein